MPALDPSVCQKASRYASRVCQEMSRRSHLIQNQGDDDIPLFERDEVIPFLGDCLGKGGFNSVYELESVELIENSRISDVQREGRRRVARNPKKYAVKFLNEHAMSNEDEYCNGAADLLMEAKYLSGLAAHPHPCLIQLYGVAAAGASGFAKGQRAGYFLIVDRLSDTLDKRIEVWKELQRRKMKHPTGMNIKLLQALFLQRIMVALDIVSALRHLHRLEIIFRDLKPDNVGFDYEGRVKLFDFGLAKELDSSQQIENGLYEMSGGTGSRRFMAPEVSLGQPYSLSADVYSFSILLWELCALEKAFVDMSTDEHKEKVVKGEDRPHIPRDWPVAVSYMLTACWKRDPLKRPSTRDVYKALKHEVSVCFEEGFQIPSGNKEQRMSRRRSVA